MYEKLLIADPRRYLERIGITGPVKPDLETLNRLVLAQLTHVPFESLDVWATGACPSLKLEDLYEKIVVKGRGGYCFELNTLFRALLNTLGFDACQVIASLLDEHGNPAPPAHNAIICHIDGVKYLVDVGYGGPVPMGAMALTEEPQLGFRLEKRGAFYYLIRLDPASERPSIRFRDIPAEPVELEPLNFYVSQKPDIHFRHRIMVSQRQPDGRVFRLAGKEFTITGPEGTKTQPVETIAEVRRVLEQYFRIAPETVTLRAEL